MGTSWFSLLNFVFQFQMESVQHLPRVQKFFYQMILHFQLMIKATMCDRQNEVWCVKEQLPIVCLTRMHITLFLAFLPCLAACVDLLSHEDAMTMNDLKTLVQQLYGSMQIEEHQLNKEQELCRRLEVLREQLDPLEKVNQEPLLQIIG